LRFRFKSQKLKALYTEYKGKQKFPPEVIDAFFEVMAIIDAAPDERDFYELKGLHYEQLSGGRAGQHSMRLNKQWRLVVEIEKDQGGTSVLVISIEDYH
jgi:proteic killer suppression protein